MKTKIRLLLAAWFCLATLSAQAYPDPSHIYFRSIGEKEGLPDNNINDIAEDRFGFMWFATWRGLARYDGMETKVFRADGGEGSLSGNLVRALCPDDGGIWVGHDSGVDYLPYGSATFSRGHERLQTGELSLIRRRVSRILRSGNEILIATIDGDVMVLDRENGNPLRGVIEFRRLPRSTTRRYAAMAPFTSGRILLLSNEGITMMAPERAKTGWKETSHTQLPPQPFDENLNLYCDTVSGIVAVGSGLGHASHEYTISDSGDIREIHRETATALPPSLMSAARFGDCLALATDGEGLYIRDGQSTVNFRTGNSPLLGDAIYKVYCDRAGNLWAGTYRHGVYLFSELLNRYTVESTENSSLSYNIVTSVVAEPDRLWIGLDGGGIDVMDRATGKRENINSRNSGLPADNVVALLRSGNIWGAVYSRGLVEYAPQSRKVTTYIPDGDFEPGAKLWCLADGGDGRIWAGGQSLHIFDKTTHRFETVGDCRMLWIQQILRDGDDMWVATGEGGVFRIDRTSGRIKERYSDRPSPGLPALSHRRVRCIFMDSGQKLWIAHDRQLLRLTPGKMDEPEVMRMSSGHDVEGVNSLLEDDEGNILAGTTEGLLRYERANGHFHTLSDSRLPSAFTANAAVRDSGNALFGTTEGLVSYPLDNRAPTSAQTKPLFTEMQVFDATGTVVPLLCMEKETVALASGQNSFNIHFTVPEMSNPAQITYQCRLEGFEERWHDATATRSATYTNLEPGDYRLLVRHTDPEGNWGEPSALSLSIACPWFSTPWMIAVWTLLVLSVAVFCIRQYTKARESEAKMAIAEVERDSALQLNDAKMDFYNAMSRELRTPCFLISADIEGIRDSGRESVPVGMLDGIYKNSSKLNELVTRFVDMKKNDLMKFGPSEETSGGGTPAEGETTPSKQEGAAPKKVANPTSTRTILIADHDEEVLSVVAASFENEFRVLSTPDGNEALGIAKREMIDVVVCGLHLKGIGGHDFIRRMKEDSRTKGIPVVVFSSVVSEEEALKAYDEGASLFVNKPASLKVLHRQVARTIENDERNLDAVAGHGLGRFNREEQKFLLDCRRIIEENLSSEDFSVVLLAEKLAMSHSALYKKLKGMTGLTVIDFINEYRIHRAMKMFRHGSGNVQATAEECGFRDMKTFRDTFRRKAGCSPREYIAKVATRPR